MKRMELRILDSLKVHARYSGLLCYICLSDLCEDLEKKS